jgi:hypothetical protein
VSKERILKNTDGILIGEGIEMYKSGLDFEIECIEKEISTMEDDLTRRYRLLHKLLIERREASEFIKGNIRVDHRETAGIEHRSSEDN